MRTVDTLILSLATILNSIELSLQFDCYPNGASIPGIPRGRPSSSRGLHSPARPLPRARSPAPVPELNQLLPCYPRGECTSSSPGIPGDGSSHSSGRPHSPGRRYPRARSPSPVSLDELNSMFVCYPGDECTPGISGIPGYGPSYPSGRTHSPVRRLSRGRYPTPVSLDGLRSMFGANPHATSMTCINECGPSYSDERPHSPIRRFPRSRSPTPKPSRESSSMFVCYPHSGSIPNIRGYRPSSYSSDRPHAPARSPHARLSFPIGTVITPKKNPNRPFQFQRYIFPKDTRLQVRIARTFVELPTDEQSVISTFNDDIFAIFDENAQILRGIYSRGERRVKFNMISKTSFRMNKTEMQQIPGIGHEFEESKFIILEP